MARLISVYRFLAARHSQLNYLTLYHHVEDFKKIEKQDMNPLTPKKNNRENFDVILVFEIF